MSGQVASTVHNVWIMMKGMLPIEDFLSHSFVVVTGNRAETGN